jgi:hypothetical protein
MEALTHISCPSCGADIEIKPGVLSVICPYCDTTVPLVTQKEATPLTVEFMVPVGVDNVKLTSMAHQLMIQHDNAPDDILDTSNVEEASFLYVPCFMGQGKYECHWSASFGFDRQEPYTDYETRTDSRGNSRQVPVTRYRTVTDWRPASGTATGKFLRLVCAADPSVLPQNVAEMLQLNVPFKPIDYNQALMGGYDGLDFARSPDDAAWALENLVQGNDAVALAYKRAQGDHQKDWSVDAVVSFDGPVKAGFIPLAKFVFSYHGKNYAIWAEGEGLSASVNDALPIDSTKGVAKKKGYIPFWVTLASTIVFFLMAYSGSMYLRTFVPIAVAAIVTLVFGISRSNSISRFSRRLREASLAGKQLELTDSTNPLPDEERRRLLEGSKSLEKPFLAKTENDGMLLSIMSAVSFILVIFSFGFTSSVSKYVPPVSSSSGYSSPATPEVSPPSGGSSSSGYSSNSLPRESTPSSGGTNFSGYSSNSLPRESSPSSGGTNSSGYSSYSPSEASPSSSYGLSPAPQSRDSGQLAASLPHGQAGNVVYSMSDLTCSGKFQSYCKNDSGPITGLVFSRTGAANSSDSYNTVSKYKDGYINGPSVLFDAKGNLIGILNYRQGEMFGLAMEFNASVAGRPQTLSKLAHVENNRLDMTQLSFNKSGILHKASNFKNGTLDGITIEYYLDLSVKSKTLYKGGQLVPGQTISYAEGQVREPIPSLVDSEGLRKAINEALEMVSSVS